MKISELKWMPWGRKEAADKVIPGFEDAMQAIADFPNGYGASVLRGGRFYTDGGTYEIGVRRGESLDYENPVANGDVLGYQTEEQANAVLAAIEALAPKSSDDAAGESDK